MPSELIWADYAILAIVGISALISIVRGFVREALSLAGWIAAVWVAFAFSSPVAALLENQVAVPSARQALAALALFTATLLVTGIVTYFVGLVVERTGLSGTDRAMGMVFGIGRGAVIVLILVLLAGLTPIPRDPWWQRSQLIPPFQRVAMEVTSFLPAEIAVYLQY